MLAHLRRVNEEQQRLSEGLLSLAPYTHPDTHTHTPPHSKGQIQLRAANLMLFREET